LSDARQHSATAATSAVWRTMWNPCRPCEGCSWAYPVTAQVTEFEGVWSQQGEVERERSMKAEAVGWK